MRLTKAVASTLANATYRFHNDQWEMNDEGAWVESDVLGGYSYEEGVAVIAACNWATLAESEPVAPADEYERLKRQKNEILERQGRSLVDASEKIAFWKRMTTTTRDSNTLLRAENAALRSKLSRLERP